MDTRRIINQNYLEQGTHNFTNPVGSVTVLGNTVELVKDTRNVGYGANISNISLNTTDYSNITDNVRHTGIYMFKIPAGAVVTSKLTPLVISPANSTATYNAVLRDKDHALVFNMIGNDTIVMKDHPVNVPIVQTFTAATDIDIYSITAFMSQYYSNAVTLKFSLELYIDDVRII